MIDFLDLKKINAAYRTDLLDACSRVIDSGWYIGGKELQQFEADFAEYCGYQVLCWGSQWPGRPDFNATGLAGTREACFR